MIQSRNDTEGLLLSITKICETIIEQTHRKAEGTLKYQKPSNQEKHFISIHLFKLRVIE